MVPSLFPNRDFSMGYGRFKQKNFGSLISRCVPNASSVLDVSKNFSLPVAWRASDLAFLALLLIFRKEFHGDRLDRSSQ